MRKVVHGLWTIAIAAMLAACGDGDLGPGCPGADPPAPDVSGQWAVSNGQVVTSTCSQNINQDVIDLILGPTGTCNYEVDQDETNVALDECGGTTFTGCVDTQGTINAPVNLIRRGSCVITANGSLAANASRAESSARYTLAISFSGSGCGVLTNCQITVQTSWNR